MIIFFNKNVTFEIERALQNFIRVNKTSSGQNFVGELRSIDIFNYLNYTCVINTSYELVPNFLFVADSFAPVRTQWVRLLV